MVVSCELSISPTTGYCGPGPERMLRSVVAMAVTCAAARQVNEASARAATAPFNANAFISNLLRYFRIAREAKDVLLSFQGCCLTFFQPLVCKRDSDPNDWQTCGGFEAILQGVLHETRISGAAACGSHIRRSFHGRFGPRRPMRQRCGRL